MQTPLRCFRAASHQQRTTQPVQTLLSPLVRQTPAQLQSVGDRSLVLHRRQIPKQLSATLRSDAGPSQTIVSRQKRQGAGRELSLLLPTSDDDILLVPCASLYIDQLGKHDVYTLSDFRRTYERERDNFRRFLQDKIEVRDEKHLTAMEAFWRAMDAAARAAPAQQQAAVAAERAAEATSPAGSVAAAVTATPVGLTSEQITLSLEGNISAGKSTFLAILDRHLLKDKGFSFVPEPLEQWQNVGGSGVNLLLKFYEDKKRLAYTFQNYVFLTRVLQERQTYGRTTKARILERSIFSDRLVFVRAAQESQDLADHELAAYDAWFGPILASLPTLVPNGIIYLRASPETCHARLQKRSRTEEAGVPLDYLQLLHKCHEEWLGHACIPAAELKQQLLQAQQRQQQQLQQQQAQQAQQAQPQGNGASPADQGEASASCCSAAGTDRSVVDGGLPVDIVAAAGALASELLPLREAPPPALGLVDIPESLAANLFIVDATLVPGVPSSGFLHQLPMLLVDCEDDVDVHNDTEHGKRVSDLVHDFYVFVAAYRSASHLLAAQRHPDNASLRLPRPAADYYTTDPSGRVVYRPVPAHVPGAPPAPSPSPAPSPAPAPSPSPSPSPAAAPAAAAA